MIKRYEFNEYPRLAPSAGYMDGCLDFWDDSFEKINLISPYPVGIRVKLSKLDVTYNKNKILSLKFYYSIGGISVEGIEHGNNIKETNNLLKTITNIIDDKYDSFTIPENDELKSIIVKYDEEQNMNYFRITTVMNKYKAWPNSNNSG